MTGSLTSIRGDTVYVDLGRRRIVSLDADMTRADSRVVAEVCEYQLPRCINTVVQGDGRIVHDREQKLVGFGCGIVVHASPIQGPWMQDRRYINGSH